MSRQTASIVIDRPREEVFAYMDDVSRESEWQPNLESAEQKPDGPTRVGTLKRYRSSFMGRTVENTYQVTELDPGRRIVYETTGDSTVDARSEIVCRDDGAATKVTMLVDARPKGALRLIPRKALEAISRDELESTLERLKKRLESPGP